MTTENQAPEGARPMPDNVLAGAVCTVAEARGYVAFGAGVYRVQETREPGLVVTFRRDGEQGHAVGDLAAEPDPTPIPAEDIIVRLQFTSAAGLDSLESHLRSIRAEHWPETAQAPAPAPESAREAPKRGTLTEAVARAIAFADSGSTEDWEGCRDLAEAAIRVCDARNPPRCSYCHASTSQPVEAPAVPHGKKEQQ